MRVDESRMSMRSVTTPRILLRPSLRFGLSTTAGLADNILVTVKRGLPVAWIDQYPQKIDALTLEQVNGAIHKYLDVDKLVLLKAGTLTQP